MKNMLPNVLAERYASSAMVALWSPEMKVLLERQLWIAALRVERDLGLPIPEEAIQAYEKAILAVNLDSIAEREHELRHDIKARIEEFNALAGGVQLIHEGFTSRDLTDNVEQLQILSALHLVRDRTVAVLRRLGSRATEHRLLDICGRSHNVPAQTTTLGKRFSNFAEELLLAFNRLEHLIACYPLRGIKGAMGTQQDMADLLGSAEKAVDLEDRIVAHLGFHAKFESVGQVYPRSLDFEVVSMLVQLSSAPANLANMIRLMAGHQLLHEGFGQDRTGSTAMPHKMNSRTCERINGLVAVLGGFLDMTRALVGNQWLEGDVSCSVVRRVALPGAFFALDGLYEAAMTVLDEMEVFPAAIKRELQTHLPFLSSTRLLIAAIKTGMGRETAHEIIKRHAIASLRGGAPETFVARLTADPAFPVDHDVILEATTTPNHGRAPQQVDGIIARIEEIVARYPEAAAYNPEKIR